MARNNQSFPPSFQVELFNYLQPVQQDLVKPILRVLKKPAQEELCCALLDYLEEGKLIPPADFTLEVMFRYIIRNGASKDNDPEGARFVYPLRSKEPQPVGRILCRMFNGKGE